MSEATGTDVPFVSVIMPIRNEADFIERSLGAVLEQTYPRDRVEILIADGMSTDATRPRILAAARKAEASDRVHILDNPPGIVPTGWNTAIDRARGAYVVRVDGHCVIAPDYIAKAVDFLEHSNAAGVGGAMETIAHDASGQPGLTPTAISLAMASHFGVGGSAFRVAEPGDRALGPREVDTVAFPAYRRRALERAGPFDETLVRNQDDEYNYRLRKLGERIVLHPDLKSRYWSRPSMGRLFRQYLQYGWFKVRVLKKHPRQMSARQFVPAAFVMSLLVGLCLLPIEPRVLLAIVLSYLGASLLAAIHVAWRRRRRTTDVTDQESEVVATEGSSTPALVALLCCAFAAMHVGYGLGFTAGLLRFAPQLIRSISRALLGRPPARSAAASESKPRDVTGGLT